MYNKDTETWNDVTRKNLCIIDTRKLTKKNKTSCERNHHLHAFSEDLVRHESDSILGYTSLEHA